MVAVAVYLGPDPGGVDRIPDIPSLPFADKLTIRLYPTHEKEVGYLVVDDPVLALRTDGRLPRDRLQRNLVQWFGIGESRGTDYEFENHAEGEFWIFVGDNDNDPTGRPADAEP